MEESSPNVIQMSQQSEQASLLFVVPNFDFVIITTRDEKWLLCMEVNSTNWTIMLVKFVQ